MTLLLPTYVQKSTNGQNEIFKKCWALIRNLISKLSKKAHDRILPFKICLQEDAKTQFGEDFGN